MNVVTVSQVNTYIKALLDENAVLKNIYIVGEISNFLHYFRSGHMYFTLKDDKSQIKAVMFSSYAQRLKFTPEDGMRVICRGSISVYEKDGAYQLYIQDIQPDGAGALNVAFEQLKQKLSEEGLFDEKFKKPVPLYPKKIGVATSDMGAAIEDIKNITRRRFPLCELVIVPTIVQGELAPDDIVKSICFLDTQTDVDIIIVGRGGGSLEDLWAFNTEKVARAVFDCGKPIISAVGHETDFTICDFVADMRAPTPSAAAELAVPDGQAELARLNGMNSQLKTLLVGRIQYEFQRLDDLVKSSVLSDGNKILKEYSDSLSDIERRLSSSFENVISSDEYAVKLLAGKLHALSPLAVIARGYGVISKDGRIIKSSDELSQNDKIDIKLSDGTVSATVDGVTK